MSKYVHGSAFINRLQKYAILWVFHKSIKKANLQITKHRWISMYEICLARLNTETVWLIFRYQVWRVIYSLVNFRIDKIQTFLYINHCYTTHIKGVMWLACLSFLLLMSIQNITKLKHNIYTHYQNPGVWQMGKIVVCFSVKQFPAWSVGKSRCVWANTSLNDNILPHYTPLGTRNKMADMLQMTFSNSFT